jgi:hypothetical protein
MIGEIEEASGGSGVGDLPRTCLPGPWVGGGGREEGEISIMGSDDADMFSWCGHFVLISFQSVRVLRLLATSFSGSPYFIMYCSMSRLLSYSDDYYRVR